MAQWARGYLVKLAEKFGLAQNFVIPSLTFCFHFTEALEWLHQLQMKSQSPDILTQTSAYDSVKDFVTAYLCKPLRSGAVCVVDAEAATEQMLAAMGVNKMTDFVPFLFMRVNRRHFTTEKAHGAFQHAEGVRLVLALIESRFEAYAHE
jgi:hypothetical protein